MQWMQTAHYNCSTVGFSAVDLNGDIYLAGAISGPAAMYIHKYAPNGNLIWSDTSGTTWGVQTGGVVVDDSGSAYTCFETVCASYNPSGTIRIGNSYYPSGLMYLVKYSPAGQVIWVKSQGNASTPRAMTIDSNGFIYVTGQWAGGGWFITKFDPAGNSVLSIPYGSICISLDGANNIYLPGKKIDPSGNLVWTSPPVAMMAADSIGNTYVSDQGANGVSSLTKVNMNGQVAWTFTVPYQGGCSVYCSNNSVYVGGAYGSGTAIGMCMYKYDSNGNQLWNWLLADPTNLNYPYHYTPRGKIKAENGIVYFSGYKQMQCSEAFLVKLLEPGIITGLINNKNSDAISVSPNPSSSFFTINIKKVENDPISIQVVDALGKIVYTKQVSSFGTEINETIDLTGFPKGVYVLELNSPHFKQSRKLIVE